MSKFIGHRENSRTGWGKEVPGDSNPDLNDIKLGCLLRIADAVEKMAQSYDTLIRDRDWYKRRLSEETANAQRTARSNASLRGYITRLKKSKE